MTPPFWTPFLPRKKKDAPEDLPLSTRVASLEGQMLSVLESSERTYGVVKKLQGKVYRGVQLGDTVDAAPAAPANAETPMEQMALPSSSKLELYRAAARLKGR